MASIPNNSPSGQRHTRAHPCEHCNGYDDRSLGDERCWGITYGEWCHCTNSHIDHGNAKRNKKDTAWVHFLGPSTSTNGAKERPIKQRKVVATYSYYGPDGKLRHQTLRYEPKGFTQRQPDGHGGWIPSLKEPPVEKVLYRLPELLKAPKDALVFVAEGEKDVDALRAYGLVATCNAMGALKWEAHYNQWLAGRHVVILPDNDDEKANPPYAGQKHGQRVAGELKQIAASVKVVELPTGKDASDYFQAGGTKEALLDLVKQSPEWQPGQEEESAEECAEVRRPLTLRELLARPKPEMLVGGLLRCQRLSMIFGNSNSAKTWVADDIGLSVATGIDWHGRKVKQGPVIYVAAEDVEGVAERSQHWLNYHHQNIDTVPITFWEWPIELTNEAETDAFIASVQASGIEPVLVIIDTFADCFSGEENSNTSMGAAMRNLERIQKALNTHPLTVHHTNKAQTAYRGHSSMRAKMDTILDCSLDDDTHLLTLQQDKQKGIRKGEDIELKLKVLPLSDDPDDTTCVLVTPDKGEIKRQQDSKKQAILRLLAGYGEKGASAGQVQKDGVELLGKKAAKTVKRVYEELARAGDVLLENVGSEKRPRYHLTITEQGRAKVSDKASDMSGQGHDESDQTREANHRTDRTHTRESVCPSDDVWSQEEEGDTLADDESEELTDTGKQRVLDLQAELKRRAASATLAYTEQTGWPGAPEEAQAALFQEPETPKAGPPQRPCMRCGGTLTWDGTRYTCDTCDSSERTSP